MFAVPGLPSIAVAFRHAGAVVVLYNPDADPDDRDDAVAVAVAVLNAREQVPDVTR